MRNREGVIREKARVRRRYEVILPNGIEQEIEVWTETSEEGKRQVRAFITAQISGARLKGDPLPEMKA